MAHMINPLAGRNAQRDVAHEYRRVIGAYIRDLRLAKDLTQKELGDLLGVGFTLISAVEVGRSSLNPEHWDQVSSILGVSKEDFGKTMLRYTNPWCYGMIYGTQEKTLKDDLASFETRTSPNKGIPRAPGGI